MTDEPHETLDEPHELPTDLETERQRLMTHAEERGIDPEEAIRMAEQIAVGHADADDYRFVDRRLVTGHTLEEIKAIALEG